MQFKLEVLVAVHSHRLTCDMGEIYEILDYMTGDSLYTQQLPRVADEVRPYLTEEFPFLNEIASDLESIFKHHARDEGVKLMLEYFEKVKPVYDAMHEVRPIHHEDHEVIDPVDEIKRINPDIKVIEFNPDTGNNEPSPYGDIDWKN